MPDQEPSQNTADEERPDPPASSEGGEDQTQATSLTGVNTKESTKDEPETSKSASMSQSPSSMKKEKSMKESSSKAGAPAEAVIRIQQEPANTRASSVGRSLIFGLSKPVFGMVAVYVLFMSGSAAYFLSQFLRLPGLDDEIESLELQVIELQEQIVELEKEVDRLAETVVALGVEVTRLTEANEEAERLLSEFQGANDELTELNDELQATNDEFSDQIQTLNETNMDLQQSVVDLTEQNEDFASLIVTQNETIVELSVQVDVLENSTETLNATVQTLDAQVEGLENESVSLQASNEELDQSVDTLTVQVNNLTEQNEELQEINDDLREVLDFLEQSLGNLNQTFEAAVDELNDMIETNTNVVTLNLEQTYSQISSNWDCNFPDAFAGLPFLEDVNSPIGATDYDAVIGYVDQKLLDELCLDRENTEEYLSSEFGLGSPPVTITVTQLDSGVTTYVNEAMGYYFSPQGADSLTNDDWFAADFDCQNLPADKRFTL